MSENSVREHNRSSTPDPGRYEWRDRNCERVLYDRFDNVFTQALVMDLLERFR
jgi:hypothetical protein